MDIHELTAELNAIFSESAEQIKAHLAFMQGYLGHCESRHAEIDQRVRVRIERGMTKKLANKRELHVLQYYPVRIAEIKLMVRAIKEGMAYRSMA
jgi:hypothetical protein